MGAATSPIEAGAPKVHTIDLELKPEMQIYDLEMMLKRTQLLKGVMNKPNSTRIQIAFCTEQDSKGDRFNCQLNNDIHWSRIRRLDARPK